MLLDGLGLLDREERLARDDLADPRRLDGRDDAVDLGADRVRGIPGDGARQGQGVHDVTALDRDDGVGDLGRRARPPPRLVGEERDLHQRRGDDARRRGP